LRGCRGARRGNCLTSGWHSTHPLGQLPHPRTMSRARGASRGNHVRSQ